MVLKVNIKFGVCKNINWSKMEVELTPLVLPGEGRQLPSHHRHSDLVSNECWTADGGELSVCSPSSQLDMGRVYCVLTSSLIVSLILARKEGDRNRCMKWSYTSATQIRNLAIQ